MTPALKFLILTLASWMNREQGEVIAYLREENRVLRERLGPKRIRFTNRERRRLGRAARRVGRKRLRDLATLASPDTLLRWYRDLVARKYDGSRNRVYGRPRTAEEVRELIVTMAEENPGWGCTRLSGELRKLRLDVPPSTIRNILLEHGLRPPPDYAGARPTSWKIFLQAHWGAIAGADFFNVEVLTFSGLVRYYVFFVIDLKTRRVNIAGISPQPDGAWMEQVARNLTDTEDGFLEEGTVLIHDRDPLYTRRFTEILGEGGVVAHKLPPRSPNLNAHAERFVRSIKEECLARVIPLGERHLRWLIKEYMEHYHCERPHQGIGNRTIEALKPVESGVIRRRDRAGGLLRSYYLGAA